MRIDGVAQTRPAEPGQAIEKHRALKEKCQDLEAVFLGYLLKTMRQSMVDGEDGDNAKGIYEGIMDQALSKALSENESLGIAKLLYRELSVRDQSVSGAMGETSGAE